MPGLPPASVRPLERSPGLARRRSSTRWCRRRAMTVLSAPAPDRHRAPLVPSLPSSALSRYVAGRQMIVSAVLGRCCRRVRARPAACTAVADGHFPSGVLGRRRDVDDLPPARAPRSASSARDASAARVSSRLRQVALAGAHDDRAVAVADVHRALRDARQRPRAGVLARATSCRGRSRRCTCRWCGTRPSRHPRACASCLLRRGARAALPSGRPRSCSVSVRFVMPLDCVTLNRPS